MYENLKNDLRQEEGLKLKMYKDINGIWSIGYGFNLVEGITKDIAEFLLDYKIKEAESECSKAFDWFDSLDDVRKEVIVDIVYNMGLPRFQGFHDTIGFIENKDWPNAAKALLDSDAAKELPNRYNKLANKLETGIA